MKEFKGDNNPIIISPSEDITEKVAFVQNLYNKADEKINHIDKLRQQYLNYALLTFSGLLAFIINTKDVKMQFFGCFGVILLMFIFCL